MSTIKKISNHIYSGNNFIVLPYNISVSDSVSIAYNGSEISSNMYDINGNLLILKDGIGIEIGGVIYVNYTFEYSGKNSKNVDKIISTINSTKDNDILSSIFAVVSAKYNNDSNLSSTDNDTKFSSIFSNSLNSGSLADSSSVLDSIASKYPSETLDTAISGVETNSSGLSKINNVIDSYGQGNGEKFHKEIKQIARPVGESGNLVYSKYNRVPLSNDIYYYATEDSGVGTIRGINVTDESVSAITFQQPANVTDITTNYTFGTIIATNSTYLFVLNSEVRASGQAGTDTGCVHQLNLSDGSLVRNIYEPPDVNTYGSGAEIEEQTNLVVTEHTILIVWLVGGKYVMSAYDINNNCSKLYDVEIMSSNLTNPIATADNGFVIYMAKDTEKYTIADIDNNLIFGSFDSRKVTSAGNIVSVGTVVSLQKYILVISENDEKIYVHNLVGTLVYTYDFVPTRTIPESKKVATSYKLENYMHEYDIVKDLDNFSATISQDYDEFSFSINTVLSGSDIINRRAYVRPSDSSLLLRIFTMSPKDELKRNLGV